ncbi:kelch-like protein 13 [Gordionus sp. m RMFG-2023]|uniref:kelch-like protein 13 n=1 Tax=Gordionus sp. m RMFG-2023 TaxID=3053472 RepID=UPI0031FDD24C
MSISPDNKFDLLKSLDITTILESVEGLDDVISLPESYRNFILKNIQLLILKHPQFLKCIKSWKFMKSILNSPELKIDSESIKMEILMEWFKNLTYQSQAMSNINLLIETIDFDKGGIQPEAIFELIKLNANFLQHEEMKDLLLKAMWAHSCNTFDHPNNFPLNQDIKHFKTAYHLPTLHCHKCVEYSESEKLQNEDAILAIGDSCSSKESITGKPQGTMVVYAYMYYAESNCWKPIVNKEMDDFFLDRHDCAVFNNDVYISGGSNINGTASSSVYRLNLENSFSMNSISKMKYPRKDHQLVAFHGRLYAIGGCNHENKILATVECYDPIIFTWLDAPALKYSRMGLSCLVHNGLIWAFGGISHSTNDRIEDVDSSDSYKLEKCVECFDPANNKWFTRGKMISGKCYMALAEIKNSIFLIGGAYCEKNSDKIISVNTIEKLASENPNFVWKCVGKLNKARHRCGAIGIGNKLYIVGGISSTSKCLLNSVECFDTESETLLLNIDPLPVPLPGPSCIALRRRND